MSGELVLSQLNESALKEVAAATEGAYVQSVGGAGDTREVVGALNRQLARSAQGQQREKIWQERYQWPLGLGLVFLMGGVLLGDGKRRAEWWLFFVP